MILSIAEIASVAHNVNKAYCKSIGDTTQTEWELAPDWQRESAIAGVKAHIDFGIKMLPEDRHKSWYNQKISDGWAYGEVKDPVLKTHPCLVDYDRLPEAQKTKDYLFSEVVHCLAKIRA
jgi:hypothetical protein